MRGLRREKGDLVDEDLDDKREMMMMVVKDHRKGPPLVFIQSYYSIHEGIGTMQTGLRSVSVDCSVCKLSP